MTELMLIGGIAAAINFIFIKWKFEKERYADGMLDVASLALLSFLFSGTMTGLGIAMIASAIISIYLYFNPPNLSWLDAEVSDENL